MPILTICWKNSAACKKGFKGKIFSTHATRDLASIMLMDTAYILQKDAEYNEKLSTVRRRIKL